MDDIRRRRILVADDDDDIRDIVAMKLERAGMEVVRASDGVAALAALTDVPLDLAVLDVMMPGLSGIDVVREARSQQASASVPIILLTARAQENDVERGFSVGATDYMSKPFSPRELLARVNALLSR